MTTLTSRIGIDLIGANCGVATAAIVGLTLLQDGVMLRHGLVSELLAFQELLPDWSSFVVAGHEIRREPLFEHAQWLSAKDRILSRDLIEQCRDELDVIDRRIRPGIAKNFRDPSAGSGRNHARIRPASTQTTRAIKAKRKWESSAAPSHVKRFPSASRDVRMASDT